MAIDLEKAIFGRRAVREYTDESIDQATIRLLIRAAAQAPSAVNEQPWTFTVIRSQHMLDRISSGAKSHMLATTTASSHPEHFRAMLGDPAFHIFYHAPALILISSNTPGPWIVEDCSLAAENLMLAAYANGLGTCWIGFAQSFLNTTDGRGIVGLPDGCISIAPIIVGRPKVQPAPVPRKEPQIRWIG